MIGQDRPAKLEVPTIEVVGTTPIPGLATEIEQVPGNVQVVTDKELDKIQATNLPDLLQRAMPSSWGLWFGAFAESFLDNAELLSNTKTWINVNPLGTAAGYGRPLQHLP